MASNPDQSAAVGASENLDVDQFHLDVAFGNSIVSVMVSSGDIMSMLVKLGRK